MPQLRIRLFGDLQITSGDQLLPPFPTQRAKSLFAFLALNRNRPVHRDVLCGLFWGDRSDAEARKALRTALWRVKSVLGPAVDHAEGPVVTHGQHLLFTGDTWTDVEAFEGCMREAAVAALAGSGAGDAAHPPLARAVALYRADLLEGVYESWCEPERERLRVAFLDALERLMEESRARGELRDAIARGVQLLRWDPLREHVHRSVMSCHLENGDRPSALRQYQACAEVLQEELGIEPMEETRRLHRIIREGRPATASGPDRAEAASVAELAALARSLNHAVAELREIVSDLHEQRHDLATAPAALRPAARRSFVTS